MSKALIRSVDARVAGEVLVDVGVVAAKSSASRIGSGAKRQKS